MVNETDKSLILLLSERRCANLLNIYFSVFYKCLNLLNIYRSLQNAMQHCKLHGCQNVNAWYNQNMLHAEYIGPELHNLIARIVNAGAIDPRDLRATPAASAAMGLDQKTIDLYAGATIPVAATFQPPGHPGRKCRLTAERATIICEHIARGAWDYIAAEAAGISQNQFYNYLERFPVFKRNVEAAKAQSRMDAEERVRSLEPSKWLRNGPGRDLPGRPGWTAKETTIIAGGANGELSGGILDWKGLDNLTEDELCTLKRLVEKAKGAPIEVKAQEAENTKQLTPAVDADITDAELVSPTENAGTTSCNQED